jgi:hypothetical protein
METAEGQNRETCCLPPQIDGEMGDHFATALSLPTLKLGHRALELPVQVSCVGIATSKQEEAITSTS